MAATSSAGPGQSLGGVRAARRVKAILAPLADRYGRRSRDAKWRVYGTHFPPQPDERVLDLGVSRMHHLPNENYFLRRFPFPARLTAVGTSDLSGLEPLFPEVTFIRADGRHLPFGDRRFDVVHSNAVVEHVGDADEQRRFVRELTRVAEAGFVTTPNRWFPIEAHTRLPLVHWLPRRLTLALLRGLGEVRPGQDWPVWLLSARRFRSLFPPDVEARVLGGPMRGANATLTIVFRHRAIS